MYRMTLIFKQILAQGSDGWGRGSKGEGKERDLTARRRRAGEKNEGKSPRSGDFCIGKRALESAIFKIFAPAARISQP